jgi:general bacterial porin, GBP family
MNKSLIALAILGAFASAASAQSSVTLYGRIDQNITYQDPGNKASINGAKAGKGVVKLNDGGVNGMAGSRFGMRGTEDLGDGLRAYFVLEAGLSGDTGITGDARANGGATSFFNRQAYVALGSKDLGDIRLGRVETLSREYAIQFVDVTGKGEMDVGEVLSGRPLFQDFGGRVSNAVTYRTPNFQGFSASAIYGLGEDARATNADGTTGTARAAEYRGIGANYSLGPIKVGITYEDFNGGGHGGNYNNVVTIGGNYDFGSLINFPVTLFAGYQNTSDFDGQYVNKTKGLSNVDHDAWNVGVKVPYGAFTFKAQYTGSSVDLPRVGAVRASSLDQHKYGASIAYALSKRTSIYTAITGRSGDLDDTFVRRNEFAFGIGHNF